MARRGTVATVDEDLDGAGGASVSVSSAPEVPAIPGTPSWLTGEFYAAIAPMVAAIIGLIGGHHVVPAGVEKELVGFGTTVVGAYALARTLLKASHVHSAAKVAAAASMSAAAVARSTPPAASVISHGDATRLADAVATVLGERYQLRRRPAKPAARRRG